MRDFFAVLTIVLVVVSLGLFRVPSDNALLDAGIRAGALGEVYQQKHPISIEVERGILTASGRVESEDERTALVARLEALEGVARVRDALTVMPEARPFTLEIGKGAEGAYLSGHVVSEAQARELRGILGVEETSAGLATGAPDDAWAGVVARVAQQMVRLREGRLSVRDRDFWILGQVHLPRTLEAMQAALADLPEGYEVTLDVTAIDDGRPYFLTASRDPLMGLRLAGKLPPDWDAAALGVLGAPQQSNLDRAPLPLDQPDFTPALEAALAVFAKLPAGTLSVGDRLVTLSGGPVGPDLLAEAEALRDGLPEGVALSLSLVPEDDTAPLRLTAEWTGTVLRLTGKVPGDFPEDAGAGFGVPVERFDLARAPYPDLDGWTPRALRGLAALHDLRSGRADFGAEGLSLSGLAADPAARARALAALGTGQARIALEDDGTPPAFDLRYDPAHGASVVGKLPRGLDPEGMALALGLPEVTGAPDVSTVGDAEPVIRVLNAVGRRLAGVETLVLHRAPGALDLSLVVGPGSEPAQLEDELRRVLPEGAQVGVVAEAALPAVGSRRVNLLSGKAEIFVGGHWLPEPEFLPTREGCAEAAAGAPQVPFPPGGFHPVAGAVAQLAELAAMARACTRITGMALTVTGYAEGMEIDVLDRQLSRRRAEAVRSALIDRGVSAGAVTAVGRGNDGGGARLVYGFD